MIKLKRTFQTPFYSSVGDVRMEKETLVKIRSWIFSRIFKPTFLWQQTYTLINIASNGPGCTSAFELLNHVNYGILYVVVMLCLGICNKSALSR